MALRLVHCSACSSRRCWPDARLKRSIPPPGFRIPRPLAVRVRLAPGVTAPWQRSRGKRHLVQRAAMDRRLAQEMPRAPPEHPLERQVPLQPGPLVPVGQPTAPGKARWQRETREVQAEPVPPEPIARRPKEVVQRAIAQAPPQVQTRIRPAQLAMARRLQERRTAAGARATAVQVQPPADRAKTA